MLIHPTPVEIQLQIAYAISRNAISKNWDSRTVLSIFQAVEEGVKAANDQHQELLEALKEKSNGIK